MSRPSRQAVIHALKNLDKYPLTFSLNSRLFGEAYLAALDVVDAARACLFGPSAFEWEEETDQLREALRVFDEE